MSEFEKKIPEKCLSCHHAQAMLDVMKRFEERKERIAEQAMGETPDEVAKQMVEQLTELGILVPGQEEISGDLRKNAASLLDVMDEGVEHFESLGSELVTGCRGLLRLRAQHDRVTYTVAICTSPAIPRGEHMEIAAITRQA